MKLTVGLLTGSSEVFVACFSALRDDLNQWRGYGAPNVDRYCIGFDRATIQRGIDAPGGLMPLLQRVEYEPARQARLFRTAVERINERRNTDIGDLLSAFTAIKNPAFQAEQEWRISALSFRKPSEVEFAVRHDAVVPYVSLSMSDAEKLPITEILVLPGRFPERSLKSTRMALAQHGYDSSIASLSTVPFVG